MKIFQIHKSVVSSIVLVLALSTFTSVGIFSSFAFGSTTSKSSSTTSFPISAVSKANVASVSGVIHFTATTTTGKAKVTPVVDLPPPNCNKTNSCSPPSNCNKTNSCSPPPNPYTPVTRVPVGLSNCPTPAIPSSGGNFFTRIAGAVINTIKKVGTSLAAAASGGYSATSTVTVTPTTTCSAPPFIPGPPTVISMNTYGTVYFYKTQNGSIAYSGSQPNPPVGLPSVSVNVNSCLSPSLTSSDMGVNTSPIGRYWTYSYTKTTTLTGPTGPNNTKDLYSNPILTPGACVSPQVVKYQCYTDLVGATFQGVTGAPNSGVSTSRVTIPTGSGTFQGISGSWSDVINTDPKIVNGIHTGPVLSKWKFIPTDPASYQTKFGQKYSTILPPVSILTDIKYCNGNLYNSINVPLALVDDGFYNVVSSGHYVDCLTVQAVGPSGVYTKTDHCNNPIIDPIVKADLERRCSSTAIYLSGVPSGSQNDIFNDPSVCGGNPFPCVKDGSCTIILISAGSTVEPIPTFSCSTSENPVVMSPSNSTTSNGGLIQVISNAKSWALYWPAATFSNYGNIKDGANGVKNPQTSLIIWNGSKPFNWPGVSSSYNNSSINTDPGAPTQPITGTPTLSTSSDPSPATIPGWGKVATSYLEFYKKGNAGDKATFSQRQWFTAYFPHTQVTMDANGNYVNTTGYIELTKSCDAKIKQSFQVLGVNALPGQ